jgi:hypothetical protein
VKSKYIIPFLLLFGACGPSPEEQLEHLNGYWEISEVISDQGTSKSYTYNSSIDYIFVDNLKGFRKKLQPGINNQYQTSDDAEFFEIRIENDSLNMYYKTDLSNWKETVLKATKDQLKIVNTANIIYIYKRFEPVRLEIDTP